MLDGGSFLEFKERGREMGFKRDAFRWTMGWLSVVGTRSVDDIAPSLSARGSTRASCLSFSLVLDLITVERSPL